MGRGLAKNYMDLKQNEQVIKIVGSANIGQEMSLSHDYTIGLIANCYRIENINNDDGTFDKVYKLKLLGQVVVENDKGQKLVAKVKGSPSQKWRWAVQQLGEDYETIMAMANSHVEEVVNFIKRISN